MKRKQFLAILLASTMVFGSAMTVSADEHTYTGTSTTANVDSSFSIVSSDLSGLIITIPANLDLTLDPDDNYYKVTDKIGAKGDLAENRILDISVGDIVTYNNADGDHCDADINFKRIDTPCNLHYWSPAELEASKTTLDERDITLKLAADNVEKAGDYTGVVTFDIAIKELRTASDLIDSSYRPYAGTDFFSLGGGFHDNNSAIETLISNNPDGALELPKYMLGDFEGSRLYADPYYDADINTWLYPGTYISNGKVYTLDEVIKGFLTNNTYLKTVGIPNTVITIGVDAFTGCTSLTTINFEGTKEQAKNIKVNSTKLGEISWSSITDTSNSDYIVGHATWHCKDGDFIPANS